MKPALPAVAVGAIVFRGEQVLLVRRRRAPSAGLWSFPGGRVRSGELLRAACRRELREETGLSLRLGRAVGVFERVSDGYHYLIVDFLAEAPAGARVRAGSDASRARWFSASDLRGVRKTPGLLQALARAKLVR